jgi:energy-coupling factor transport system substrate-specific component
MIMLAFAIAILFVQEQVLAFLPNIQFSVVLLIVYSSVFSKKEMFVLIFVYVFLDSMYYGGLNPFYMIPMLLAWSLIPIIHHSVLHHTKNEYVLAIFALFFGFIYGWMFIPFHMIQTSIMNPIPYLVGDLLFEVIMGTTGFLSVLWVYRPLVNLFSVVHSSELYHHKQVSNMN